MYNGRFKSFTYGADGQLAINHEKQWGDSIVNNNAEHFSVQSTIKAYKDRTNESLSQIEYFENQNKQQSRQLDFLSKKIEMYDNISKDQNRFYSGQMKEQYANYKELSNRQENFCNASLNKNYTNISQQQNLLMQQQRALEHFENMHQMQVQSNNNIQNKHNELTKKYPEYFTDPSPNNSQSQTQGQQPKTQDQQPKTQDQQPKTQDQQPKTQDQQPQTQGKQPQTQGKQPQTQGKQPQTQGQQQQTQGQQQQEKKCLNDKYESVTQKCKWNISGLNAYDNEEAALNACNADTNCKGYATMNNKWYLYNPMDEKTCEKGEQHYCKRK